MSNQNVKIGDKIKVVEGKDISSTARNNPGKALNVIALQKIHTRDGKNIGYVVTDAFECGGIWLDEFEIITSKLDKVLE